MMIDAGGSVSGRGSGLAGGPGDGPERRPARPVAVVAPVAGLLLGVLDFVWIKYVPFPYGSLGNSIAVWAVAAYLLTLLNRWSLPAGVLAAAVQMVVAVPAYYLAAAVIQNDDLRNAYDANAVLWSGLGLIVALVFGSGGVLARWESAPERVRDAALALPGAVMFAEAAVELNRIGNPSYTTSSLVGFAAVLIVLGLVIIGLITPTWRRRGLVLGLTLPLTAAGFVLLHLTGFH
jgi:hypothetical protein